MVDEKRVAVVVPAHNEEHLIGETLAGIPEFVDRVFGVNKTSTDATADAGRGDRRRPRPPRAARAERRRRRGDRTGYERAREEEIDIACVMAADDQMDPADLPALVDPVAAEGRLRKGQPARRRRAREAHPAHALPRRLGAVTAHEDRLRLLARRRLADRLHRDHGDALLARSTSTPSTRGYGCPNDLLVPLNVGGSG